MLRSRRDRSASWAVIILTGAGAGLVGGLLMKLLRTAQRLTFPIEAVTSCTASKRSPVATVLSSRCWPGYLPREILYVMKRSSVS